MQRLGVRAPRDRRRLFLIYAIAAAVMVSAFIPLWAETRSRSEFTPQGASLDWDRLAIALHLITDVLIGLAYVAISITLIVLARRAGKSIPFLWAFVAFGIFIIACGLTHFMAAITLWEPVYWLAGSVKYVTALASVGTALVIPPLVPRVVAIARDARLSHERKLQLEASNRELEAALDEAQRTRTVLQSTLSTQQNDLELLALEVQARREEAQAAIRGREEFLSIAAHELKTPLTTIKMTAQLLQRRAAAQTPDQQRLGLQLTGQIERLEALVTDLLDVALIQRGELILRREPLHLAEIASNVISHFDLHDRNETRRIVLSTPETLSSASGHWDRLRIEQVMTNLLSNALKFSPPDTPIVVTVDGDAEQAILSVADQGRGIAQFDLQQIFQPFSQSGMVRDTSRGSGLGLYISRWIVELHAGSIAVVSEPGQGTTFTVRLPRG